MMWPIPQLRRMHICEQGLLSLCVLFAPQAAFHLLGMHDRASVFALTYTALLWPWIIYQGLAIRRFSRRCRAYERRIDELFEQNRHDETGPIFEEWKAYMDKHRNQGH